MTFSKILIVFVIFTIFFVIVTTDYSRHKCVFVELGGGYYGIFFEDINSHNHVESKSYLGLCDLPTLRGWQPYPFLAGVKKIHCSSCDMQNLVLQPRCNCTGSFECRQLEPIPDFPTCFLERRCRDSKCTFASRRHARTAPVINNCIQCMTKHPNVGEALEQVKRRQAVLNFRLKQNDLLDDQGSGIARSSSKRKYRPPPKNYPSQRERQLELNSNVALVRILRRIPKPREVFKRQETSTPSPEDEIEDDDDDNDDNIGEDIAIEEDQDVGASFTTTEEAEKDELRQQQHQGIPNYNFTEDKPQIYNKTHMNGSKNSDFSLALLCVLLSVIINF